MERTQVNSGAVWEDQVGYSRAVAVGPHAWVSGTVGEGANAYVQAVDSLRKCRTALERLGFSIEDVVRTRAFVMDITDWGAIGRAHAEVFGKVRPATTMVQVSALISPEYLLEFEVEAFKAS